MGFFEKISKALKRTKEALSRKLDYIFSGGELNDDFYEELTDILIASDMGFETSMEVVENLRLYVRKNKLKKPQEIKEALKNVLKEIIDSVKSPKLEFPAVITMVGVNGVGKTTTLGKLANFYIKNKKEVVLVAGDTFRAGAIEQLSIWAERNKARIIKQKEGSDPAAVVFDAVKSAQAKKTDVLLVDTAGRLHTKTNLMQELEKIGRILEKEYKEASKYTLLVLDATVGQNAINQFDTFNKYIKLDGIVLTKLDGTAKGGIVVALAKEAKIPVLFVGVGETIEDLEEFSSKAFVENLF